MASDQGQQGESAMLRFFLPGLVVGTVLGSMLGLYVGTRSGSAVLPDVKRSGPAMSGAPSHDDEVPATPPPAEPAAAEKKPADPAGEAPKNEGP
ncbi:MAG: hypothetical protein JNK58_05130 [Phycisphaerae bacterium]|nr:hypothetical protein [Phycisphaerae bacterium]